MDENTTNMLAQPTDDIVSSNGQADEDDPFALIYGDFNNATDFLDSLEGRLAAERDRLRAEGLTDEDVADKIVGLQQEAASLRFTSVPAGRSGVVAITATITRDFGDIEIDVFKIDPADVSKRIGFAQRLSAIHPAIEAAAAERLLMQLAAELAKPRTGSQQDVEITAEELLKQMPQEVIDEARAMLESPDLLNKIVADVQALGVAGEEKLIKQTYLIGTSRLLPEPCGAIVQGPSAGGKSFTTGKVASCFPKEAVTNAHTITPNAFYYMPPGSLKHKFVVAGERSRQQGDDTADATKALRELRSDGVLRKLVTDTSASPPTTRYIEQEGPIAYIETTTAAEIFAEDLNRNLLLSADERPEQTQLVLDRIAAARSGSRPIDSKAIIQRHWAMQRMLNRRRVLTPFATQLSQKFNTKRVEARRAFGHLCNMIEAVALLFQYQRQLATDGCIIAELRDYEIAADLCRDPLARLLGGKISDASIRFYKRLIARTDGEFTTTDAAKWDDKTNQGVRDFLHELAKIGAVEQTERGGGSRPAKWKLTSMGQDEVEAGGFDLPTVDELLANETPIEEPRDDEWLVEEQMNGEQMDDWDTAPQDLYEPDDPDSIPF